MKGVIFSEFLNFVEYYYSYELVDEIIIESGVKSGGAYTSVGTYPSSELSKMIAILSSKIEIPVPLILNDYGMFLFNIFIKKYKHFIVTEHSVFTFLSKVDSHIHDEVRKIYKNSELPSITYTVLNPKKMIFIYQSKRGLADLAEGLIKGCIKYFSENIKITRRELGNNLGTHTEFVLDKLD